MRPSRIAGLALAALTLSGCGQASSHPATQHSAVPVKDVLTAAVSKTSHAGSARFTMTMTMTTDASGTVNMQASGVSRLGGHPAAAMHLSMSSPVTGRSLTMDERMLGTTLYMRSPALARTIPGAKPWLKLDLQKLGRKQGVDFSALLSSSNSDPTQGLDYLRAASDNVLQVGTARIDGVETTHYHAVVDMHRAMDVVAARAPRGTRAAVRKMYRRVIAQSGVTTYPIDVWIGSDGLVRQMKLSMPMPQYDTQMDMSMRLTGFGDPVHVSAPPAAQVTDLTALAAAHSG
jgi:hypothetical protein